MKRVFAFLTDYLIKKGLVQEEDRPIYEYGFQILIEIFLWVLCCTIIAALTCSLIELCIFFIIFFPIRSYAGGFHFRKFSVCLPFSCTTFLIIIYLSRIIIMPRGLQLCNSFFLLVLIFIGNIKENENSDLEIYCKKRLRLYLMLNIGIGVVLFEFCEQQVLNVYMETLLLIVISSVLQNRKSFLKD